MTHDTPRHPDDVEATLDLIRNNALQLLSAFTRPPCVLRIQAGEITVEAEWPVVSSPSAAIVPASIVTPSNACPAASGVAAPSALNASQIQEDTFHYLRAPAVGVVYLAPEPGVKPFVAVGDIVVTGQQVAIIEVMKLMMPVHADDDGRIIEVLKANGEAVEYNAPLFAIAALKP